MANHILYQNYKNSKKYNEASNIFNSLKLTPKKELPVKILFIQNPTPKSECLYILSRNVTLSASKIVHIFENRWSIECIFQEN